MEKEARIIRGDTMTICWHMRGGLSYTEAMNLSHSERQMIGAIIKDHMDTTKKTGLPFF